MLLNLNNLELFDNKGNNLNWVPSSLYNFNVYYKQDEQLYPVNCNIFINTNTNGIIENGMVIDKGYNIPVDKTKDDLVVTYTSYGFVDNQITETVIKISNDYLDIGLETIYTSQILNEGENVSVEQIPVGLGITHIEITDSTYLLFDELMLPIFPTITFSTLVNIDNVSVNNIETSCIHFFEKYYENDILKYRKPITGDDVLYFNAYSSDGVLENVINIFDINSDDQKILWQTNKEYTNNETIENIPFSLHVGCFSYTEAILEQSFKISYNINNKSYTFGEIIFVCEVEGEDERYNNFFENFGLPHPKKYQNIFKQSDIYNNQIDWKLINNKSKELFLEYKNIFPYAGTYKALFNALKWLGYDDITFKEWYKNIDGNEVAIDISSIAKNRAKQIVSIDKNLSKLNKLTMVYLINDTTGNVDQWGVPIVNNVYIYDLSSVQAKLIGLKDWLEKYIIGINCSIKEITGEGIYFSIFSNNVYSTTTSSPIEIDRTFTLNPSFVNNINYFDFNGSTSIQINNNFDKITFEDLQEYNFQDFVVGVWDLGATNTKNNSITYYDYKEAGDNTIKKINIGSFLSNPYSLYEFSSELYMSSNSFCINSTYASKPIYFFDGNKIYIDGNSGDEWIEFNLNNIQIECKVYETSFKDISSNYYEVKYENTKYNLYKNDLLIYQSNIPYIINNISGFRFSQTNEIWTLYGPISDKPIQMKYGSETIYIDRVGISLLNINLTIIPDVRLIDTNPLMSINFVTVNNIIDFNCSYTFCKKRQPISKIDFSKYLLNNANLTTAIDYNIFTSNVYKDGEYSAVVTLFDEFNIGYSGKTSNNTILKLNDNLDQVSLYKEDSEGNYLFEFKKYNNTPKYQNLYNIINSDIINLSSKTFDKWTSFSKLNWSINQTDTYRLKIGDKIYLENWDKKLLLSNKSVVNNTYTFEYNNLDNVVVGDTLYLISYDYNSSYMLDSISVVVSNIDDINKKVSFVIVSPPYSLLYNNNNIKFLYSHKISFVINTIDISNIVYDTFKTILTFSEYDYNRFKNILIFDSVCIESYDENNLIKTRSTHSVIDKNDETFSITFNGPINTDFTKINFEKIYSSVVTFESYIENITSNSVSNVFDYTSNFVNSNFIVRKDNNINKLLFNQYWNLVDSKFISLNSLLSNVTDNVLIKHNVPEQIKVYNNILIDGVYNTEIYNKNIPLYKFSTIEMLDCCYIDNNGNCVKINYL